MKQLWKRNKFMENILWLATLPLSDTAAENNLSYCFVSY